jgi:succinate dehydrogenase / fumarate reductase flavoprotein subunit
MQGLADGYFIVPYTVGSFLAGIGPAALDADHPAFEATRAEVVERTKRLLAVNGSRSVDSLHRALGRVMWDKVGMSRNATGLREAIEEIRRLREEFWADVRVLGSGDEVNQSLEHAGRVADFMEFGELLALDALHREESCGGHFREEHQTPEGEAQRDDARFAYVAAWEYTGPDAEPRLHTEPLEFHEVKLTQRSYK